MATEKGLESQSPAEDSCAKTILPEKNPEVSNEDLEPVKSESKSEKEHPVASEKMDTTESAADTVGEDKPNTVALCGSDSHNVETGKQQSSSLSMDIEESEDTTEKFDNHNHDSRNSSDDADDTSKNSSGNGRESEKTMNELAVVEGEKTESGIENESSTQSEPGKPSNESAEESEGHDDDEDDDSDDCQFVESVSPSSKEFKLKQTRVHDWVQSPSQTSYKDKPSFKHNLPHWVDHFDSFFTFVKQGTTDSEKNPKPFYVFQCKLCVGVARKKNKICRVRHIGNFLTHLKFHPKQYTKFATDNPRLVTKKKPKRCD